MPMDMTLTTIRVTADQFENGLFKELGRSIFDPRTMTKMQIKRLGGPLRRYIRASMVKAGVAEAGPVTFTPELQVQIAEGARAEMAGNRSLAKIAGVPYAKPLTISEQFQQTAAKGSEQIAKQKAAAVAAEASRTAGAAGRQVNPLLRSRAIPALGEAPNVARVSAAGSIRAGRAATLGKVRKAVTEVLEKRRGLFHRAATTEKMVQAASQEAGAGMSAAKIAQGVSQAQKSMPGIGNQLSAWAKGAFDTKGIHPKAPFPMKAVSKVAGPIVAFMVIQSIANQITEITGQYGQADVMKRQAALQINAQPGIEEQIHRAMLQRSMGQADTAEQMAMQARMGQVSAEAQAPQSVQPQEAGGIPFRVAM